VSTLSKGSRDCHWFTATPSPARSVFKPYTFTMQPPLTDCTSSDSGKSQERKHLLWLKQASSDAAPEELETLEESYIKLGLAAQTRGDEENLFNQAVEAELRLYAEM